MKEVANPDAKNEIYKMIQTMLEMAKEKINSDSNKKWDSVFWRDENTRPDNVSRTLNETLNKSDKETKDKLMKSFNDSRSKNNSLDVDASTIWMKANLKLKKESSSNSSSSSATDNEKYDKEVKEIAEKVEWNGEKFVAKPMHLTRVNLSKIRNNQTFQDNEIAVSYSTAFLELKMYVPEEDNGSNSTGNCV